MKDDGGKDGVEDSAEPATVSYQPFPSFLSWGTSFFDDTVFARSVMLLEATRQSAPQEALNAAVERATRAAAVDTGAIEGLYQVDRGFTRTVATQTAAWEAAVSARGEHVRRAIEDALAAYEFVLDAATQSRPVTETWLRELHQTMCASQETYTVHTPAGLRQRPLPKGRYKTMPNNPTSRSTGRTHHYASVLETPSEMGRLIEELRTKELTAAHPVLQAAYAHYAYVCIHPFADGNGRVARALASVFLYRRPGIPLVVFADQRDRYLDALEAADAGNPSLFVNFVELCAVDTIGVVCASIHPAQGLDMSLAALERLYASPASAAAREDAGARLRDLVYKEFNRQIGELRLPPSVTVGTAAGSSPGRVQPDGYREATRAASFRLLLSSGPPAQAGLIPTAVTYIRVDPAKADLLVGLGDDQDALSVDLREIQPVVTETLRLKIEAWVEGRLASSMARLVEAAERAART
ncbi:MAG: Fic family protein [Mycobacteriales bacterium]